MPNGNSPKDIRQMWDGNHKKSKKYSSNVKKEQSSIFHSHNSHSINDFQISNMNNPQTSQYYDLQSPKDIHHKFEVNNR